MDQLIARDPVPAQIEFFSRRAALLGGSIFAVTLTARCRVAAQGGTPAAEEIVVEALGAGLPVGMPGRQLGLLRMTFPAEFIPSPPIVSAW